MGSSDSDSSSDWNRELFIALTKKQGKGRAITEQYRCEQIQECLDQGANVNSFDKNGHTVLDIAVIKGYHQVANFLRRSGAQETDHYSDQTDCRATTLANDLGDLKIASLFSNPIEEPSSSSTFHFPSCHFETSKRKLAQSYSKINEDSRKRRVGTNDDPVNEREADTEPNDTCLEGENFFVKENDKEVACEKGYAASGLKRSTHGIIYQLKHLMLVLNRTWKMKYAFRLSSEMDSAEKFDDLVLHYKDNAGNEVHRFMQVKHKQDRTKTINARQLLDVKEGEFSILKYFVSWRRIMKHKDFAGSSSKIFILCTNIGLDVEGLKAAKIMVNEVKEPDEFLWVKNRRRQPPRYKLILTKKASGLYETLKTASDLHQLCKILAQRVDESKEIDLRTEIFKLYHIALAVEVIDTKRKRFSDAFIKNQNLSASAANFREIFFLYVKNLSFGKNAFEEEVWQRLGNCSLKLSSTFGSRLRSTAAESKLKQFTQLPDDLITAREISEFLNEFVLAVEQPNEVELGEMIKREIGTDSQFNLLEADLIGDSFQSGMLDWFKEAGKCGKFLQNEDAEDFFHRIEFKLSSLITMGLSLEHPEKLKTYGVRYRTENSEIRNFINRSNRSSNQILQFVSSSETLLTSLRIHQTLMGIPVFGKNDSFIFIQLKTLLLPKILKRVLRAFQWPRNHNLLIIDCEDFGLEEYSQKLWNPLSEIMKTNSDKRLILIIQGHHDSTFKFQIDYQYLREKDEDIGIDNLKQFSRQKLLEKEIVIFQGNKTSFGRLFGNHTVLGNQSKKYQDLSQVIDADTLVRMIHNEEIWIGNEVKGLGEVQDYYIPRTIVRHVIINLEVLRAPEISDVFALSNVAIEPLRKFLGTEGRLGSLYGNHPHDRECFVLTKGKEEDGFKTLCELIPNYNIHWLDCGSGKAIWIQSFGDITDLVSYKDTKNIDDHEEKPGAIYLEENELVSFNSEHRVVILSNTAGMGKSTILTYLAYKMKENEPNLLVIRINLTQHTTALAEEMANRTFDSKDTDGAVEFLVEKLSGLKTDLELKVYKTIIKDQSEVALLFDGFDEISPTYGETVVDLLQAIAKLPIKKIFVTTRPYTSKTLEEKLRTFSHALDPFSVTNQIDFLTKFWSSNLNFENFDHTMEERVRLFAEYVLLILADSIDHRMKEFTGIPLQTRLVAEVFQYGKVEIPGMEDAESKLPTKLNIIDLYECFVDNKYDIFFTEKQLGDQTNLAAIQSRDIGYKMFLKTHQKFALDALFPGIIVASLLISQPEIEGCMDLYREINERGERTGIITQVINGVPHFIHRTFAEYFASIFLLNTLKDEKRNQELRRFFVTDLFVKSQYKVIRAFLNCLLSKKTCEPVTHPWNLDLSENHLFDDHETLYHVAAKEHNVEIARFFLNHLIEQRVKSTSSDNVADIPLVDYQNKDGKTALGIAASLGDFGLVECLVKGRANVGLNQSRGDETALHSAAERPGNFEVVKYLVENGADIHAHDEDGETPLHKAVSTVGNLEVVKYLIEKGSDVDSRNEADVVPLQYAVRSKDNFDIVKYLIEKGADVHSKDKARWTVLHTAVQERDNFDMVKCLIENGADYYAEDLLLTTPWGYAVDDEYTVFAENHLIKNGGSIPKGYSRGLKSEDTG